MQSCHIAVLTMLGCTTHGVVYFGTLLINDAHCNHCQAVTYEQTPSTQHSVRRTQSKVSY